MRLSRTQYVSSIAQRTSVAFTGDPSECRHPNSCKASATCPTGGLSVGLEAAKGRARRPAGRSMEPALPRGNLLAM